MPDAPMDYLLKFMEYGGVAAVLALGWWKAESRADKAQTTADERATTLMEMMSDQVESNGKVSMAIELSRSELSSMREAVSLSCRAGGNDRRGG